MHPVQQHAVSYLAILLQTCVSTVQPDRSHLSLQISKIKGSTNCNRPQVSVGKSFSLFTSKAHIYIYICINLEVSVETRARVSGHLTQSAKISDLIPDPCLRCCQAAASGAELSSALAECFISMKAPRWDIINEITRYSCCPINILIPVILQVADECYA